MSILLLIHPTLVISVSFNIPRFLELQLSPSTWRTEEKKEKNIPEEENEEKKDTAPTPVLFWHNVKDKSTQSLLLMVFLAFHPVFMVF